MSIMQVNGSYNAKPSVGKTVGTKSDASNTFSNDLDAAIQNLDSSQGTGNSDSNKIIGINTLTKNSNQNMDLVKLEKLFTSLLDYMSKIPNKDEKVDSAVYEGMNALLQQIYQMMTGNTYASDGLNALNNKIESASSFSHQLLAVDQVVEPKQGEVGDLATKVVDALSNFKMTDKDLVIPDLLTTVAPKASGGMESALSSPRPLLAVDQVVDALSNFKTANKDGMAPDLMQKVEDTLSTLESLKTLMSPHPLVKESTDHEKVKGNQAFAPVLQNGSSGKQQVETETEKNTYINNLSSSQQMDTYASQQENRATTNEEAAGNAALIGEKERVAHYQLQDPTPVLAPDVSVHALTDKVNAPLVPARFFAKEMEAMVMKQVQVNKGTGTLETMLRLFPENLGQVDVKIAMLNGQLTAQFMTSSAIGKQAIEQQLDQLTQSLLHHGLQVDKLEVSQVVPPSSDPSNNSLFDQGQDHSHSQQERQEERGQTQDSSTPLPAFADELEEWMADHQKEGIDMTA